MTETTRYRPTQGLADHPWFALYTAPQAEEIVARGLRRHSFQAYLPMSREIRPIRRRFDKRPRLVEVSRPAFRGYVFVGLTRPDWFTLRRMAGVLGVVANDSVPIRIPAATIEDILCAEDMGIFDVGQETAPRLVIGQHVRFVAGPMEGYEAVVAKPAKRTALVTVDGRPIRAPVDQIRVVA